MSNPLDLSRPSSGSTMAAMTPEEESNINHSPRDQTETINPLCNDEDRKYIEEKKNRYHPKTRLWVFKKVHEWLELETDEFQKQKVFWISGAAGTGKTVISAKLEDELGEGVVIAHHFCRHDLPKKNSPMQILLSIGKLISKNLNLEQPYLNQEDINSNNIDVVFHAMLEKPLKNLRKNPQESRKVIILDALDEIESESLQMFLHVFTTYFSKLPDWVGIFITSRYQANIADELDSKFNTLPLHVEEEKNLADLQVYILHLTQKYKISNNFQIEHLQREVEEEFKLEPNILKGKLKTLKDPIQSSLTIYNRAIEEIKEHEPIFDRLIEKIVSLRDPLMKQDLNDFEKLYEQAEIAQKIFGGWLIKTFGNAHVVDPGVKSKERCKEKIRLDYNNNVSQIHDISRFTMRFDTFQDLLDAYKKVQECDFAEVVQVKNKFFKPDAMGYRDINLNIKVKILSSHIHISELQLNMNKVLQAKERCHGYYEKIRVEIPNLLKNINIDIQHDLFERYIIKRLYSPTIDVIVSKLMEKSAGLFQYARLLEDTMEHLHKTKGNIEYDEICALPTGLNKMYQVNFDRVFSSNNKETRWKKCKDFISLVCAAEEPLPKQIVMEILTKEKYIELQTKISLLFPEINGKVHIFHKSIVEWLRRSNKLDENDVNFEEYTEVDNSYYIDESTIGRAYERLAGHCLNLLLPISELSSKTQTISNIYAIKYIMLHAHQSKNKNQLLMIRNKLLFNIEWLVIKIKQIGPHECLEDYILLSSLNPTDRPLQLMKHALQLSLPALYKDTGQLYSQLLGGRLSMVYEKKPFQEIELLLKDLNEYIVNKKPLTKDGCCWKPITQILTPAGNPCEMIMAGNEEIYSVAFSPDEKHMGSGSDLGTIKIWNVKNGKSEKVLKGHTDFVYSLTFSPGGNSIASCSQDKTIRIWDVQSGKCEKVLEGHTSRVYSVSFSPNGKHISSGSMDKTIRIWDIQTGKCEKVLKGHTSIVYSVSSSPDGKHIGSGCSDKTIRIWDIQSGKCEKVLEGHTSAIHSVTFSPDGKHIGSGCSDKTIRIWDVQSGKCEKVLEGHTHWVCSVSFCPKGKHISSGSYDETIRIWDVQSGKCEKVLKGHTSWARSVAFSPDGKHISSGSLDLTIRIWDVQNRKCEKVLDGHTLDVWSVSFSANGKHMASVSYDKTIRIWDVQSGKCEKLLEGHTDHIKSVSFSADGKYLSSDSHDETIRVWDVQSGKCEKVLDGQSSSLSALNLLYRSSFHVQGFKGFSSDGLSEAFFNRDRSICVVIQGPNVHILSNQLK